jgi:uncharacterized protein (TIGR02453 family)
MIFPHKDERTVPKFAFDYLTALKNNNNRAWFEEHRQDYVAALAQIEQFTDDLLSLLQAHDVIETQTGKKALYRIFRNNRFTKDKTPYKTNWLSPSNVSFFICVKNP